MDIKIGPLKSQPREKKKSGLHAAQCSEECTDLYVGETNQELHKHMAQHKRASSSGQDSVVYVHLKDNRHYFEDNNGCILDRWFEREIQETIYVKCEKPTLTRGGGGLDLTSNTYIVALESPTQMVSQLFIP